MCDDKSILESLIYDIINNIITTYKPYAEGGGESNANDFVPCYKVCCRWTLPESDGPTDESVLQIA